MTTISTERDAWLEGYNIFAKREKPPSVVENLLTKIMDRPQTVVSREEFTELMRVPEHLRQSRLRRVLFGGCGRRLRPRDAELTQQLNHAPGPAFDPLARLIEHAPSAPPRELGAVTGSNLGSDATLVQPWSCNAYQTGLKQVELGVHTFDV
jgi:hypothetical protein